MTTGETITTSDADARTSRRARVRPASAGRNESAGSLAAPKPRHRHFTGIIRDITERKQAERRLKLYADEITDKHAELKAQHAELMRSKEALARSLSQVQKLFAVVAEALERQTIGGRYRLDRRLARGGFGVVYQRVDVESGREIAAKVLSPPRTGEGKAHLERFRREGGGRPARGSPECG